MKKRLTLLIISLTAITSFNTLAADKYITDDLPVYLRRGPGDQYALSGSLNAGDKVTILAVSNDGRFTQVRDHRGRTAWLPSNVLKDTPSDRARLPALEQQLAALKQTLNEKQSTQQQQVDDLTKQLADAQKTIEELNSANQELHDKIAAQQTELESMNNQLDEKRQSLIMQWFLYGGMVAGGGLLLGLILPAIMPKRRRKDRWM